MTETQDRSETAPNAETDGHPKVPTFEDVLAARKRLAGYAALTPTLESPILNERVGARVLLKAETLQRTGAFKFRGAHNCISQIDKAAWPGGVVACSSGNHAQGVAEAARLAGLPATIVMPRDAPRLKLERTRRSGAEIVLFDRDTEDREAIACKLCGERGALYVPPYDHPDIITGQGTAGLELHEQAAAMDAPLSAVLVPASGGGLVSGIALGIKHLAPDCDVYSVEPEGFDDYARSLASGRREHNARLSGSICDSLLIGQPGEITFALSRVLLTSGVVVSDDEARAAMRFAFEELKLVVEPGGAVGLAALLSGRFQPATDGAIGVILSGGNVDPLTFCETIA
ncbi:threonine ammonia-lyase [Dichotomicrobium thermohalophilum]|uniref:Threonine dehydratase n=1 Tax=Dichotomicrobium thermohalophilum TaxID=933063 RepID=A0A397Q4W4_9HYPH|nr:threonine/serine dehydratase [Dichotomicrobium thermohalophilum]RIA56366.1 threonine dehydratase [Dichotomicrobium thermohalophilum]